jgi:4a-hydroxytetrahydrobiopterin dehydratase
VEKEKEMGDLAQRELVPPRGKGHSALGGASLVEFHELLGNDWKLVDDHHLEKIFSFKNFQEALEFTNKVGALAEAVDHHPELCLTWGRVSITIWTHSIGGLSEADFVFAARSDELFAQSG